MTRPHACSPSLRITPWPCLRSSPAPCLRRRPECSGTPYPTLPCDRSFCFFLSSLSSLYLFFFFFFLDPCQRPFDCVRCIIKLCSLLLIHWRAILLRVRKKNRAMHICTCKPNLNPDMRTVAYMYTHASINESNQRILSMLWRTYYYMNQLNHVFIVRNTYVVLEASVVIYILYTVQYVSKQVWLIK